MNPDPLDADALARLRLRLSTPPQMSVPDMLAADTQRPAWQSLARFISARLGPGRLSTGEYAKYGTGPIDRRDLARFAGVDRVKAFHSVCNDNTWFAVTKNKLLFETLLRGAGLPSPQTHAVWERKGRSCGYRLLADRTDLRAFLFDSNPGPVIAKPVAGVYSLGVLRLDEPKDGTIGVNGVRRAGADELISFFNQVSAKGYLFQEPLVPDPGMAMLIGGRGLVTLRFLVLMERKGPRIEACVAKIPGPEQVADNFWRSGAALLGVDPASGNVFRAVSAQEGRIVPAEDAFPAGLLGAQIPGYENAARTVLRAAALTPAIRTQSWDLALAEQDAVPLEVNFGGDLSLIQIGTGRGLLTPAYCAHLRNCGFRGRLP